MLFNFFQRLLDRKNFLFLMQVSQETEILRAILTTRITTATKINMFCCNNFPGIKSEIDCSIFFRQLNESCVSGEAVNCYSADTPYDQYRYPPEFLNSLENFGLSEHHLTLKIGMPIILIKILDPKNDLCNGVRLVVVEMAGNRLIVA